VSDAKRLRAPKQKFEARNPKFETISNDQNKSNSKQAPLGLDVLDFPDFRFICFSVYFGFRNSDFGFMSPGYWHDKVVEDVLFNISKVRI
jgi:hypothetical protein